MQLKDLEKLECPINWGLPENLSCVEDTRKRVLTKVANEVNDIDDSSTWQKICQCLVMSVLEYKSRDFDFKVMGTYLEKIEDVLNGVKGQKCDALKKKHVPSIEYVTNGIKAYWHFKLNEEDKAKACLLNILPFIELSKENKAAVYALKACCFMEFAHEGFGAALESINKALELDADDPEWNFLKGKCLARTRRCTMGYALPSMEELDSLGKAAKSEDCSAYHLVFCGQSLLEYAQLNDSVKHDGLTNRTYLTRCAELFRRAAEKGENDGVILVRVAKGLMHMWGYNIEDLLDHCLFRSLELLPTSGFVNAVVGEYYYIRKKDIDQAIPYLRIASRQHKIMSSYRYLLNILFLHKPNELDEEIEIYWENYKDNPLERVKVLKTMAAYNFFARNDIVKAATYWKEWVGKNDSDMNRIFVTCRNFTAALVGEVNCVLKDPKSRINSDEEQLLRSFLEIVKETRPRMDIIENCTPRAVSLKESVLSCKDRDKDLLVKKFGFSNYGSTSQKYNSRYSSRSDDLNSRSDSFSSDHRSYDQNHSRYGNWNDRNESRYGNGYDSRYGKRYDSRYGNGYDSRYGNGYDSRYGNGYDSRYGNRSNDRNSSRSDSTRYASQ